MRIIPRVYQKEAVKAGDAALRSRRRRALVVLATGLGKTITAALIAKKFGGKRILFLVHNNFILEHAMDEFKMVFPQKTKMSIYNGITKDGAKDADIVFATWQTMGANINDWGRRYFDLVIVDEAHHTGADTYRPVVDYFQGARLAITATPDRSDDIDIRDIFGKEVINVTLEEAIARGWLPRIEYHVITDESLNEDTLQKVVAEIRESKKRFTMAEVNRRVFIRKRDTEVARIINGYNEKTLVFCANIDHAERMSKVLDLAKPFHSRSGSGQSDSWKKNQKVLDDLRNGKVRKVCAVDAFNEGVNVPTIGLVAFCRVTDVLTIFRQQLGRGLRPGKDKLVVLDFVGNLERIQLVLDTMNRISDLHEKYTSRSEKNKEGYTREKFEVSGRGFEFTFSDQVVDLVEVLEHCERDFYPTWQEASKAAIGLGITTQESYKMGQVYKKDLRLHSNPESKYKDFPGWKVFLGGEYKDYYPTWQEASVAARKLKIKTMKGYKRLYKRDPRLHSSPNCYYSDFPGYPVFLGTKKREKYPTWQEASMVIRKYKFTSKDAYVESRGSIDSALPYHPERLYEDFPGWSVFLRGFKKSVYKTCAQAQKAARQIGFKSCTEYLKGGYRKDQRLPADPSQVYKDFPGWSEFLGTVGRKSYDSCKKAMASAKKFGFRNKADYQSRCKKCDPLLPVTANTKYKDFPGWDKFLGKK